MKRVAVVGGGVSGLTVCRQLERNVKDIELTLFEAEKIGGKVQTVFHDNCVVEEGADSFLLKADSPLDNLLEDLGLKDQLISPRERTFAIQRDGVLHSIPLGMLKGFPKNLISLWRCSLFSLAGKFAATLRPAQSYLFASEKEEGDPSIAKSLRARYGREVSKYFFETVFGGIHSGDAHALSFRSLYPDMANPKQIQGGKYARARFVSFPKGMNTFTSELANSLVHTEILSERVDGIQADGREFRLRVGEEESSYDCVVIATPAYVSSELVKELSPELSSALSDIKHSSSAIATLVIPRSEISTEPRGSGYLMSPSESGFVTGCTYSSQKWEGRAPDDHLLMRVFFGRNGGVADVSDEDIRKAALEQVREKLGYTGEPPYFEIRRWDSGLPQYHCGHALRLQRIEDEKRRFPGLFLTGTSFRGVGIPDCVKQAYATAQEVEQILSEQPALSNQPNSNSEELGEYGKTVCA